MAISKPRANGMRQVFVYQPALGRKVYVGQRKALRGPGGAQELEREKTAEFNGQPAPTPTLERTCEQYATRWLAVKHGEDTPRPAEKTEEINRSRLGWSKRGKVRPDSFLATFGDRPIRDGISREEALDWCKGRRSEAKTVAAMFADAIDDGWTEANPFGNRRLPGGRGRQDIEPLTEQEVDLLAEIARQQYGVFGLVVAGWILFLAWTGCRPGEAATRTWSDVDPERDETGSGRLTVPRIKGDKQTDVIVLPAVALDAILAMPGPRSGRLFLTPQGKGYDKGSFGYFWRPVRAAFIARLAPERLRELQRVKGALDLYALRHFCGSYMADKGANEFEIAAQLGNSPEVCRDTYIHVYRDRVNERNASFLARPQGNVVDLGKHRKECA